MLTSIVCAKDVEISARLTKVQGRHAVRIKMFEVPYRAPIYHGLKPDSHSWVMRYTESHGKKHQFRRYCNIA